MSDIAKRLLASVRMDAINGDAFERGVCSKQMAEAARYIQSLESRLAAAPEPPADERDAEIARLTNALEYGWSVAGYKITDGVAVDKPHKFGSYIAEMMAGKDAEITRLNLRIERLREEIDYYESVTTSAERRAIEQALRGESGDE